MSEPQQQSKPAPLAIGRLLTPSVWEMISAVAPSIHAGHLWPVPNAGAAASIMVLGYELGLSLGASFEYIDLIDGRPSLSPQGALALIRNSPMFAGIEINEFTQPAIGCTVTMHRKGGESFSVTFTVEDAKEADLVRVGPKGKGGWLKYPKNLCRWRAIGYCADYLFPDVLGGLKRADEYGAEITDSGEVIDADWTAAVPAPVPAAAPVTPAPEPPPAPTGPTLEELVNQYGAEAILVAGKGSIPGTSEELAAVVALLEAEAAADAA